VDDTGAGTVVIFGGRSEIGTELAVRLAPGATVVLAARGADRLVDQIAVVRAAGAAAVDTREFDADDLDSHEAVVGGAFERHGDLDLVLVAFGVLGDQERSLEDPDFAAGVLRTNFLAAASTLLTAARRLRAQGHGALVVLSSVAGERARRSNFVYGASKAGLDACAQGLGDELAADGIQVMVVRPGMVRTKMTAGLDDVPFTTTPDAVAREIVKGLRRGAHTVWVPPALRLVMAGLRHLPRPVFRRLNV
jgi:short-subunit dehydrogenase